MYDADLCDVGCRNKFWLLLIVLEVRAWTSQGLLYVAFGDELSLANYSWSKLFRFSIRIWYRSAETARHTISIWISSNMAVTNIWKHFPSERYFQIFVTAKFNHKVCCVIHGNKISEHANLPRLILLLIKINRKGRNDMLFQNKSTHSQSLIKFNLDCQF